MSSLIYLDNNATTSPLSEVVVVVASVMRDCYGNPGSPHRAGRLARQVLEESREQIAGWLGANPKELIFTSGGTEANNLAIRGLTHGLSGSIAISPGEHPSCLEVCTSPAMRAWNLPKFPVDRCGRITSIDMPTDTRLAAVILAHNETGVI
ncbi:MAG: aminotransferase class V-fold PLP-dependent enzyme, partial [Candidatus Saccharimonas sp.]|nr:aminotransferase class V-fold PLP-dependent enzyme [Planctomycetaceae bacterium]